MLYRFTCYTTGMTIGGSDLFLNAGAAIALAAIFGLLARYIKFPPLVGYVAAGLLLSPLAGSFVQNTALLDELKHVSFALLVFFVGLELNPFQLREQIRSSIVLAIVQIAGSFALGVALGYILGLPISNGLVIGLALSFTSGVSVIKLLSDSGELNTIHGRSATSLLLIQDLLACVALVLLTGLAADSYLGVAEHGLVLATEAIALIVVTWYCARYALPWLFSSVARSPELLAIFSIGWFFLFTFVTTRFDMPAEAGALLAGISLAGLPYTSETVARLRTVRDLVIVFSFVGLGSSIGALAPGDGWFVLLVTFCVVIVRPLISMVTLAIHGFRARTAFLAGITQGQLSEFSLLFLAIAASSGYIAPRLQSQVSWVVVISIIITSALHAFRKPLLAHLAGFIRLFERGHHLHRAMIRGDHEQLKHHAILVGYHRTGYHILKELREQSIPVLVIDMDPDIVRTLRKEGVPCIYGDVEDEHMMIEHGNLAAARIVVSTLPHKPENLYLLELTKRYAPHSKVILTARNIEDALSYYNHGADYVLLPHLVGSEHIGRLIKDASKNPEKLTRSTTELSKLEETLADRLYYE